MWLSWSSHCMIWYHYDDDVSYDRMIIILQDIMTITIWYHVIYHYIKIMIIMIIIYCMIWYHHDHDINIDDHWSLIRYHMIQYNDCHNDIIWYNIISMIIMSYNMMIILMMMMNDHHNIIVSIQHWLGVLCFDF